jgi:glycosyltransferase involved in cell wall biosynthesis
MIFVWVNKRNWKTAGPIVNIAVHNAASFASLGYETHLCLGAGEDSDTQGDLKHVYGLTPSKNFKVHRIPRWQVRSSTYSLSVFLYAYRLIKALSRRDRVVVITRESGFLLHLSLLCRNHRIKGYYELHDFYADLSLVSQKKSGHYREKFYEHLFLPYIYGLVCITREQQRLYRSVFPLLASCAFPLGTKPVTSPMSTEERRKKRTLMYVGHMHEDKGIDFLLQASVKCAASGINTLFWGGKEKRIPLLQDRARQLGLGQAVEFVPFRPLVEMHRALAERASVGVVMLSDTFYNRYLTCPVKALDYLSHGIPAIGSDLPSVREVLGPAGTYVPPNNLEGFVRSARRLLDDPEHYNEMTSLSLERASEISWKNRAKTIADFVQGNHRHGK